MEGEIKANEYVRATKIAGTDTYTLGPGGFYVEIRGEGQSGTKFGFMAYDSHAKVYTTYYANSAGLVGCATATFDGNTWTAMVEDKLAGNAIKGRTTITIVSPIQFTLKYEMLDANGRYVTLVEGTANKVAP